MASHPITWTIFCHQKWQPVADGICVFVRYRQKVGLKAIGPWHRGYAYWDGAQMVLIRKAFLSLEHPTAIAQHVRTWPRRVVLAREEAWSVFEMSMPDISMHQKLEIRRLLLKEF